MYILSETSGKDDSIFPDLDNLFLALSYLTDNFL